MSLAHCELLNQYTLSQKPLGDFCSGMFYWSCVRWPILTARVAEMGEDLIKHLCSPDQIQDSVSEEEGVWILDRPLPHTERGIFMQ